MNSRAPYRYIAPNDEADQRDEEQYHVEEAHDRPGPTAPEAKQRIGQEQEEQRVAP